MTDNVFLTTAATILEMSIADAPWVDVGYGKRPKHGRFFNKHFRPNGGEILRTLYSGRSSVFLLRPTSWLELSDKWISTW